jgi:hypothetical protein
MKKWITMSLILSLIVMLSFVVANEALAGTKSLVRVYVKTADEMRRMPRALDVAGRRYGEWIDVVATPDKLAEIQATGLLTEIIIEDVEAYSRSVKGAYRSFPQMVSDLQSIAVSYPSIAHLDTLGLSYEGRPLLVLKISDNVGTDEDEPELLFMGLHHAREWPSLEIACFIADTLTAGYGVNSHIADVVDSREIWVMPCVNPDGYVYGHDLGNDWRKNGTPTAPATVIPKALGERPGRAAAPPTTPMRKFTAGLLLSLRWRPRWSAICFWLTTSSSMSPTTPTAR